MRRVSSAVAVVIAIAAAYTLGRHASQLPTERRVLYYVDPMHPAYKSSQPGTAPDCGMRLEPVYAGNATNTEQSQNSWALPAGAVSVDNQTRRAFGIRLTAVEKNSTRRVIRTVGRVAPEDTRTYAVNSGMDGFIRETYNDAVGTPVRKNQKLATYYAPEFLAPASGFLAANERVPGSVAKEGARSIQNYTDRLRNLGMSDVQIRQMAESRQLPESIDVVAPAAGFIVTRNISPGQHFIHDTDFYRIADLRRMWVTAEVAEQEAPYLHPGAAAQIMLRNQGRRLPARLTGSLPQSEAGGGTVKFRLEADNPQFVLRPDMLVDVEWSVNIAPAITVPADAVVDSGERARVYVEDRNGIFQPRAVETGWRLGDQVQILRGLEPGERVVASSTFLIDSESRLKSPAFHSTASAESAHLQAGLP